MRCRGARGRDKTDIELICGVVYFRSAETLSMPALAQASSLSPPGAPEMPMAPITSLADHDRQRALGGHDVGEEQRAGVRIALDVVGDPPDGWRKVRAV